MRTKFYCILLGIFAGILDVIPMIIMNLTWDANLSAFSMWVIISFFLSNSQLELPSILKGLLYSFLTLLPSAIIIGWNDPKSLLPMIIMTIFLGSLLGFAIGKIQQKEVIKTP